MTNQFISPFLKNFILAAKWLFWLRLRQTRKMSSTGHYRPASGHFARLPCLAQKVHFSLQKRGFQERANELVKFCRVSLFRDRIYPEQREGSRLVGIKSCVKFLRLKPQDRFCRETRQNLVSHWFRRIFFSPPHAIILSYDHFPEEFEFEEDLEEVGRFYRFVKTSDLVGLLQQKKSIGGLAVIALLNARKSALIRAIPVLDKRKIPYSLFLRSDCIGLNQMPTSEAHSPIEGRDPSAHFATWGEICRLNPFHHDLGIHCDKLSYCNQMDFISDLTFIRQQSQDPVRLAYSPEGLMGGENLARQTGIIAVLTSRKGVVRRDTSPLELPSWNERTSE